jgi:hypothetical protein
MPVLGGRSAPTSRQGPDGTVRLKMTTCSIPGDPTNACVASAVRAVLWPTPSPRTPLEGLSTAVQTNCGFVELRSKTTTAPLTAPPTGEPTESVLPSAETATAQP